MLREAVALLDHEIKNSGKDHPDRDREVLFVCHKGLIRTQREEALQVSCIHRDRRCPGPFEIWKESGDKTNQR